MLINHIFIWIWEASVPKYCDLCHGPSGFFHRVSHFPLCSPWPFPALPITPRVDSCKMHFTVSMANPLSVRFSPWEQLAWYLEGGKRGEAWCFSFPLGTSGFISCGGCTFNGILLHNCLFFPAPTRNHPQSFQTPLCHSRDPSAFLCLSNSRNDFLFWSSLCCLLSPVNFRALQLLYKYFPILNSLHWMIWHGLYLPPGPSPVCYPTLNKIQTVCHTFTSLTSPLISFPISLTAPVPGPSCSSQTKRTILHLSVFGFFVWFWPNCFRALPLHLICTDSKVTFLRCGALWICACIIPYDL